VRGAPPAHVQLVDTTEKAVMTQAVTLPIPLHSRRLTHTSSVLKGIGVDRCNLDAEWSEGEETVPEARGLTAPWLHPINGAGVILRSQDGGATNIGEPTMS
jgi:hypothetical protein